MPERLGVTKTYKLFINGAFPRTESGRTTPITDGSSELAHVCNASRKDLRNAVEAARKAQPAWAGATAYLRGQIVYRLAEMLEGKRTELARAIGPDGPLGGQAEVDATIDRLVAWAGWPDKLAHVLGHANPVAGPYHCQTLPEPTGVVCVLAPESCPLLALVSLTLPAVACGNTSIVLASTGNPVPAMILAEAIATSDLPKGVINILTSERQDMLPHIASHRDIDAIHASGLGSEDAAMLEAGAAENMKRVTIRRIDASGWGDPAIDGPWWVEPMLEMKTTWHPSSV